MIFKLMNWRSYKIQISAGFIILILILTNPAKSDFDNYVGFKSDRIITSRTMNFFFFSTYQIAGDIGPDTYLGILGNFIHIRGQNPIGKLHSK